MSANAKRVLSFWGETFLDGATLAAVVAAAFVLWCQTATADPLPAEECVDKQQTNPADPHGPKINYCRLNDAETDCKNSGKQCDDRNGQQDCKCLFRPGRGVPAVPTCVCQVDPTPVEDGPYGY